MDTVTIRDARPPDMPALADLMTQLGYPSTGEAMARRLARLGTTDVRTFVAESNGAIVGMAGVQMGPSYEHDEPLGRLIALVVDEGARRTGVGGKLLDAVEAWVRERGGVTVTLTTRNHRVGAHAFYRRMGYEQTGLRFVKTL